MEEFAIGKFLTGLKHRGKTRPYQASLWCSRNLGTEMNAILGDMVFGLNMLYRAIILYTGFI